jgi:putative FmdB family regulatory protein
MPTYSYACTECDNKFDIVQSFSDDSLTVCPQCTGKLRKLFNSVGIDDDGHVLDQRVLLFQLVDFVGEGRSILVVILR